MEGYQQSKDSQPGLEPVIDDSHHGMQAYNPLEHENLYKEPVLSAAPVHQAYGDYGPIADGGNYQAAAGSPTANAKPRSRLWLLGGAVLIAIIAGVIGGVVGWKVTENNNGSRASSPSTTSPATSNNTDTGSNGESGSSDSLIAGANNTIRANSALAVTGWRYGSDFAIRLFYQGPDDVIRFSGYDTLFGNWTIARALDVEATSKSPLATTVIWRSSLDPGLTPFPQIQSFYRSQSKLSGQNWRDGGPATGFTDSIEDHDVSLPSASRLGVYWPSVLLQDASGAVQEVFYNQSNAGYQPITALSISGSTSSPLIALPLTPSHEDHELRILYRRSDGKLAEYNRNSKGTVLSSSGALSFSVPQDASVAAFATANGNDDLKTWVLWQDDSGDIQVGWQNSTSDLWEGPVTDAVFKGADNPTQLACLTAGSSGGMAVEPLQAKNDMNRCYFQIGGAVKEVWYDGDKWVELGYVNMPL